MTIVLKDKNGNQLSKYFDFDDYARELYSKYSNDKIPSNIKHYSYIALFNDKGILEHETKFISKEESEIMYKSLCEMFAPYKIATTTEVIAIIGDDSFRVLASFLAYNITERQGGYWIFE